MKKAIVDKKVIAECNFTDRLLLAPPLSYMITHKDDVQYSSATR